jgi:hypothetical protein
VSELQFFAVVKMRWILGQVCNRLPGLSFGFWLTEDDGY